jgi:hypothetical protein
MTFHLPARTIVLVVFGGFPSVLPASFFVFAYVARIYKDRSLTCTRCGCSRTFTRTLINEN